MLDLCLDFNKPQSTYAYKRYAYKKRVYFRRYTLLCLQFIENTLNYELVFIPNYITITFLS